jgi:hypothetical protein
VRAVTRSCFAQLAEMVSYGRPNVVASLKSLLETGEPLPDDA